MGCAHGKSTGVVVACELTDATPAAFATTHPNRNQTEAIAAKVPAALLDFLYAGGLKYFAHRQDGQDLLAQYRAQGYQVATTPAAAQALTSPKAIALLAETGPPCMPERTAAYMQLGVTKALDLLGRNRNGFS